MLSMLVSGVSFPPELGRAVAANQNIVGTPPADSEAHKLLAPATEITPAERRERENAIQEAYASVALEGFQQTPESIARAQRFIDGEIDLDEFNASSK